MKTKEITPGYFLKKFTGRVYVDLCPHIPKTDDPAEAITAMAEFCRVAVVDSEGKAIHETTEDWLEEDFDLLETCGNAVLDALGKGNKEAEAKN